MDSLEPTVENMYVPARTDEAETYYMQRDTFWDLAGDDLPEKPNKPLPWYWQN
jgi:hypothetical protein